ncbi:fructose-bisphosphate aldolase [Candidatus Kaiserbacteria bacterium RIFCSPHIGHO2_01_FULL_50_13]|uniref:Fructose-bisphosphate aldolase n=1 Tax=Candidatus Kaiserbacteria bacterium RIFCSPLOWO2_01_FULL_50_24 TaxID=1798507 RepID=A0A1F6EIM4_9BACT|nr:MAG: fructose-bisphosphate aldolase [Candidatus Kaiserbacteria bacterium RIFCSPHIGHO2_01_FULL_50_13]OGG73489.1 MAG: fructose-bisphosphate aldolase [Candidatus Kaiserbacteria bacterium RIFCSPLOWO2_01_FULL_50_24]OGG80846.1 MAG: fructose-bisphosphate aldolase [Candidatus Kaiserbacteria bacterium RIFCSPLOWO2_02_FULL_51_13]
MNTDILKKTAKQIVASGKGIIAADESNPTCQKRFDAVGVACTEENRRAYRDMLLTTEGLEHYVSGVILYDETIRQRSSTGERFPDVLTKKGMLPGIKVDIGAKDLALHSGEKVTEGLDGLRERLAEYKKTYGAMFAKWRAVITIGDGIPTDACIHANAHAMARYAALCQEVDIVPIVEPEVLIDGNHMIEACYEATEKTLKKTFEELAGQDVILEGTILKASMVIAGKKAAKQSSVEEVARETVRCLKASVPSDLAGVVFLSGGQGDEQATANLNEMNKLEGVPWPLSFSYARAIQNPALKIWAADTKGNIGKAQEALLFRSKMNSLATMGKYSDDMEKRRTY